MNFVPSIPIFGYLVVGCLPFIVFRRGRYNLRWLATAVPFFLSACALVTGVVGWTGSWFSVHPLILMTITAIAIIIIWATALSHQQAPALWHQNNGNPGQLVTTGTYRFVRHPFYSSFLLLLVVAWLALPSFWTLVPLAYGTIALEITARSEERSLHSLFGESYSRYVSRSGRFIPPLKTIVSRGDAT